MARFHFDAVDARGRRFTDSQEAPDRATLLATLESRGIHVVRWRDAPPMTFFKRRSRRLSSAQRLAFVTELAQLLRSGVPVDRALKITADASSVEAVRRLALQVRNGVRRGQSLSEALMEHGPEFSELTFSMIRVGEVGGVLDTVLEKLADYLARTEEIKKFILSSSIYPLVLLVVGAGSVAAILGFVVPKFAAILQDLNAPVPPATRMLIAAAAVFRQTWWIPPVTAALAVFVAFRYREDPKVRRRFFDVLIKMPGLGAFFVHVDVIRFARTLGTLVLSGVPLLKSLAVARAVLRNEIIREAVDHLGRQVQQGKSLSAVLKQFPFFPPLLVHMTTIGEETGRLGEMLLAVAETLEVDVQGKTKAFLSFLEPAVIVSMGILIGGMVVSMLLAIFGIHEISF